MITPSSLWPTITLCTIVSSSLLCYSPTSRTASAYCPQEYRHISRSSEHDAPSSWLRGGYAPVTVTSKSRDRCQVGCLSMRQRSFQTPASKQQKRKSLMVRRSYLDDISSTGGAPVRRNYAPTKSTWLKKSSSCSFPSSTSNPGVDGGEVEKKTINSMIQDAVGSVKGIGVGKQDQVEAGLPTLSAADILLTTGIQGNHQYGSSHQNDVAQHPKSTWYPTFQVATTISHPDSNWQQEMVDNSMPSEASAPATTTATTTTTTHCSELQRGSSWSTRFKSSYAPTKATWLSSPSSVSSMGLSASANADSASSPSGSPTVLPITVTSSSTYGPTQSMWSSLSSSSSANSAHVPSSSPTRSPTVLPIAVASSSYGPTQDTWLSSPSSSSWSSSSANARVSSSAPTRAPTVLPAVSQVSSSGGGGAVTGGAAAADAAATSLTGDEPWPKKMFFMTPKINTDDSVRASRMAGIQRRTIADLKEASLSYQQFLSMKLPFTNNKDRSTNEGSGRSWLTKKQRWPMNLFSEKNNRKNSGQGPSMNNRLDTRGMTERIMKSTSSEGQAGGAGGSSTWEAFQRAENNWSRLKSSKPFLYDPKALSEDYNGIPPPTQFVTQDGAVGNPMCWTKLRELESKGLDYDIIVCGGTLGIFFAAALQMKGHKVCVLEAGKLRGREQEWNISMNELMELVELGILSRQDVEAAVKTEFPGCRSGFKNKEETPLQGGYFKNRIGYECVTDDVLNLGVSPAMLLEQVSKRFKQRGGVIIEETRIMGVAVSDVIGAAVDLGKDKEPVTSRLVIDCMGNASPISRQQRYGLKPDGVCAVVGCCASGFDKDTNLQGDIIYTNTKIVDKGENGKLQYFWEAFPVGIGRDGNEPGTSDVKTTYMFTYMDADEDRPSLESLMEDYWQLLPVYQPSIQNPETDLDVKRVLFAYFPTYRDSPLKPKWNRVLAVGDASGIQSPLSFGGFGALTRHLDRISTALTEALDNDFLHKEYLGSINAYTPNLAAAWMFQRAMSVRMGQNVDPDFVNRLLAVNFEVMDGMGERTIKPFLQDVIRFDGLVGSLARSFVADPLFMPQIVAHVGVPVLADWLGHVSMMGLYDFLDRYVSPALKPRLDQVAKDPGSKFLWRRRMEAWKFGSGNDYKLPEEEDADNSWMGTTMNMTNVMAMAQ